MKKIINVSKVLLIAVIVLFSSHFAFAARVMCVTPGSQPGTCSKWSCGSGDKCVTHNNKGDKGHFCQNGDDPSDRYGGESEGTGDAADPTNPDACLGHVPGESNVYNPLSFINDSIPSPVPALSPTESNQYVFKSYPFTSFLFGSTGNAPIPVNDPLIIGGQNPSGSISGSTGSSDTPVDIDIKGNVPELFSFVNTSGFSFVWPPVSVFNNMQLWANSLADTFKTFTNTTWSNNFAANSKWYPLNYLTLDNPSSMLPLIPVTLKWNKPALAPNAVAYHLSIQVAGNPLGIDTNLSNDPNASGNGIDVPVLNATTYTFTGRSMVQYYWYAQPLDASGNVITGPVVVSKGGTGYTNNPFWITKAGQMNGSYYYDSSCHYVAGRIYFTGKDGLGANGDCNPINNWQTTALLPSGTYNQIQAQIASGNYNYNVNYLDDHSQYPYDYNGEPTGGYRKGYEFIEWSKDNFPLNLNHYEIQYAFRPIPDSVPFTDGATFNYTAPNQTGQTITFPVTTHVISNIPATNNADLSESRPGYQYDFGLTGYNSTGTNHTASDFLSTIANSTNIGTPGLTNTPGVMDGPSGQTAGIYWRVRGIGNNGNPVRLFISPSGFVTPPAPIVPFQSGFPVWTRNIATTTSLSHGVTPTTGYVVDVVKNIADFDKLPKLDGVTLDTNTISKDGSLGGTTDNNTFLLRRVVPEKTYNAGTITTNKFKDLLLSKRINYVEVNGSNGYYEDLEAQLPFAEVASSYPGVYSWNDFDQQDLNAFNSSGSTDPNLLDNYYPKLTDILGMTLSSPAVNKITINTVTPVIIKSTGTAMIGIVTSSDHKTNTLTFGATSGYYSFSIKEVKVLPVIRPLLINIGSMPALPVLTNKAITEFDKLLPGTTYYWRQRCIRDPNAQALNTGATAITFCPWSATQSFTTLSGVPASITVQASNTSSVTSTTAIKKNGLSKLDASVIATNSFDTVINKNQLKGVIKPLDLSKVKPTTTPVKINLSQLKARMSARQILQKVHLDLINSRLSKDAGVGVAQANFAAAIKSLLPGVK